MNTNDIGKGAHVIKNTHRRCVVGDFDKFFMEDIFRLGTEHFYLLSYTNYHLFTLYIMVQKFTTNV